MEELSEKDIQKCQDIIGSMDIEAMKKNGKTVEQWIIDNENRRKEYNERKSQR